MMDNLLGKFREGFKNGYFIRIGDVAHNMFIGKDEDGHFCFEFRGRFRPMKLVGSKPLLVNQYQSSSDEFILRFALEQDDLLGCFAAFGEDLIDAAKNLSEDDAIYTIITNRYQSWKKLFRPNRSRLTEPEIMGLLGELLFLKEKGFPKWGISIALDSWTGPEKTHKDFSHSNVWYEIKTINCGKETVHISSIEQLDSDVDGFLYIYCFEKMSPSFNGLTLNNLVQQILSLLTPTQKDAFLCKLVEYNYDFASQLDTYVFRLANESCYTVNANFPRLKRSVLPLAITKTKYDIVLTEIEPYKTTLTL